MKKTLNELFWENPGQAVEYEGLIIRRSVSRHVKKPGRFIVRFIKAIPRLVQALRIDIDPGQLIVAETESPKMVLRLDTSPDTVEELYRPSPLGSRITFYNAWINEDGGIDAWLMNAGMLVEEEGNKMILRCSDGRGDPTFDDLIVEIEFMDG